MKYLAQLKIEGYPSIEAPSSVPTLQNTGGIGSIFSWAMEILVVVGIITALGFIIYGGFKWISSGGDKQKLDQARKTIVFSIVGLILLSLSLVIVKFVGDILGITYF